MAEHAKAIDTSQFVRGGADAATAKPDNTGRATKQSVMSVRLKLADGYQAMIYGHQRGGAWMSLDATRIEIPFEGLVKLGGKWQRFDGGDWLAVIAGRNLGAVLTSLLDGKKAELHPNTEPGEGDAFIDRLTIEPLPWEETQVDG